MGFESTRTIAVVAVAAALVGWLGAPASAAPNPARLCEAAVETASGKYAQCRLTAESKHAKLPDAAKRNIALAKCSSKLESALNKARTTYGAPNCTAATAAEYDAYLAQCSDDAVDAARPGGLLPACGNAAIEAGEQCDGANLGGETCASLGFLGGTLACDASCALDTAGCFASLCGNGAVNAPEQCDGANLAGATCASLGYTNGGTLGCTAGCGYDTSGCRSQSFLATGQTSCWDTAGDPIACAGTGHDGALQRGATLAYVDNANGTVTDQRTGLVWEKLSDDGSIHDRDDLYTWSDAFAVKIAALNAGSGFAGHKDWRLPNRRELESLVDMGRVFPAIAPAFDGGCLPGCTVLQCSCTNVSYYWASTSYALSPSFAWFVGFNDGYIGALDKADLNYVRAVRAGS
jgi:hypothetical protein